MRVPTILVVDDNVDMLSLVKRVLSVENYNVVLAQDGVSALASVVESAPDVVVLDVEMPIMNGLDVCRALRENPDTQDVPIVMLTARTGEKDIIECFARGASDYIAKPFSLSRLRARVKTWVLRGQAAGSPP